MICPILRASRFQKISEEERKKVSVTKRTIETTDLFQRFIAPFLSMAEVQLDKQARLQKTSIVLKVPNDECFQKWDFFTAFCEIVKEHCEDVFVIGNFELKTISFSWNMIES
jgi:hypothetical protein